MEDVPEIAGGLINNGINLTVHIKEDLLSDVSVKELDIVVQIILQILLKVVDIVAELSESIGHGLCASFGETCANYFHFYCCQSQLRERRILSSLSVF